MATREEILRQQRDRELERAAQANKKAKQIDRLLAGEKRKRENRRKYVAGGYLLRALIEGEKPCQSYEELLEILDKTLTRNVDRRAFDLPERTELNKKKRRKKKTADATGAKDNAPQARSIKLSESPKANLPSSDEKPVAEDQSRPKTSLPASLLEATIAPTTAPDAISEEERSTISPTGNRLKSKPLPEVNEDELLSEFNI